ncbi:MAG TPA: large conductance mechanosensitive channel protein MscL [Thermoplasmata archaeon]|nr:large conductance mechanosensitive channel protein MscL [Thermoplasmata archaeon]
MGILDELKAFALKGSVVDMAVGIIIGTAFTALITALVGDIFLPLISIPGSVDFSTVQTLVGHGLFKEGAFLTELIAFIIIVLVVFFLIVKPVQMRRDRAEAQKPKAAATTKECPYCISQVPLKATRCMYCTSQLTA